MFEDLFFWDVMLCRSTNSFRRFDKTQSKAWFLFCSTQRHTPQVILGLASNIAIIHVTKTQQAPAIGH
jgi:hypothetical protein